MRNFDARNIFDKLAHLCELNRFFRLLFDNGYACAMIVHTRADQLLPQLLMVQFNTCRHNTGTLDICMKNFDAEK